jgi:hypothetical protein
MPATASTRLRSPWESALRPTLLSWIALLLASPGAAGPRDPLYQWSDAAGAVRYTTELERIPVDRRAGATVVAAGRNAVEPAAATPAQPAPPEPAPRAEPAPDAGAALPPVEAHPPAAAVSDEVAEIDARIAELERSIAADEAALGDYISDPERAARQRESGEVAAITKRLPRLQDELRVLRKRRDAATASDEP